MPAFHGAQVVDEFGLQVDAETLPDQADGAAGKSDVVARLDTILVAGSGTSCDAPSPVLAAAEGGHD